MPKLKINNSIPVQENFLGNGAVYHGYAGMPDKLGRIYTDEQCEIEAKRAADMRIKIVRTKYDWWAWDKNTNTWDWDNPKMTAFYAWLKRMKDADISVSLNAGWCSPGDILSNSWNGVSPFTVADDWQASVNNFGDWVSETVHQIVEVRGFTNVKYLTLFTEPQQFKSNGEPMYEYQTPYDCWYDAAKATHDALVRDCRRHLVKIMGPNEGSTYTSNMLRWVAERNPDFVDIYSSHTYPFAAEIPYDLAKNGIGVAISSVCGGRIMQNVELQPNTEYTCITDFTFENCDIDADYKSAEKSRFLVGVYEPSVHNDLFDEEAGGPLNGISSNSLYNITADKLVEGEQTFSFKFTTGSDGLGQLGFFFDIHTKSKTTVTRLDILDAKGKSVIDNPTFNDSMAGWSYNYVSGADQAYTQWYRWCKTGMQYVPKGKEFCFDEYNITYDRDYSNKKHGALVVTAALAFMNAGAQTSFIWTLFDQLWPNTRTTNWDSFFDGEHRCGVMPTLFQSPVPHRSFYAFSLLSRYVTGEGTAVYAGESKLRLATTMSVSPDGDITIIVVNGKNIADEFEITFKQPLDDVKFNRHTFDPESCVPDEKAQMIGIDKVTEPISKILSDRIAPYGVTVYTTISDQFYLNHPSNLNH